MNYSQLTIILKVLKILLKGKDDIFRTTMISRVLPNLQSPSVTPLVVLVNVVLSAHIIIENYRTVIWKVKYLLLHALVCRQNVHSAWGGGGSVQSKSTF